VDRVGGQGDERQLLPPRVAHVRREAVQRRREPCARDGDSEIVPLARQEPPRGDGRRDLRGAAGGNRQNGAAPCEEEMAELVDAERDSGEKIAA